MLSDFVVKSDKFQGMSRPEDWYSDTSFYCVARVFWIQTNNQFIDLT